MSWRRLIRSFSTGVCFFLLSGACIGPSQNAQTLGQELRDVPISLGDMAFNEGRNRGFDGQQVVTGNDGRRVRVYDAGEQLGFHVFPGFAPFYNPEIPRIAFDQEPQTVSGRLGYYRVLLGKGSRGSLFNYQKWIRRYLNSR